MLRGTSEFLPLQTNVPVRQTSIAWKQTSAKPIILHSDDTGKYKACTDTVQTTQCTYNSTGCQQPAPFSGIPVVLLHGTVAEGAKSTGAPVTCIGHNYVGHNYIGHT